MFVGKLCDEFLYRCVRAQRKISIIYLLHQLGIVAEIG